MKLPWSKVSGIITDGAPGMAGEQSGLSTRICKKVSDEGGDAVKLHCIIHQQVLCAKHLPFAHVMKLVAKAINFIRSKALCHRQFQQFLHDIEAEYGDVSYHNNVRWLSMGSAPQQFFSLRREIGKFLVEKGGPMQELSATVWIADLTFLVDMTKHLNALNISLQRQNAVISELYSHIKAFKTKLQLFQRHWSQTVHCTTHFPALRDVTIDSTCVETKKYAEALIPLASDFNNRFRNFAAIEKRNIVIHFSFQRGS